MFDSGIYIYLHNQLKKDFNVNSAFWRIFLDVKLVVYESSYITNRKILVLDMALRHLWDTFLLS